MLIFRLCLILLHISQTHSIGIRVSVEESIAVNLMCRPVNCDFLSDQEPLFVEVPEKHIEFNSRGRFLPDSDLDSREWSILLHISDHKHGHLGSRENLDLLKLVIIGRGILIRGLEHIKAARS